MLLHFEQVTKYLQEDFIAMDLASIRTSFDSLREMHPGLAIARYLSSKFNIIHDQDFENAVVKVQNADEVKLS